MKKREIFLLSSTVFSLGLVLGFVLAPIKKGINVYGGGSISNNYGKNEPAPTDEEQHLL